MPQTWLVKGYSFQAGAAVAPAAQMPPWAHLQMAAGTSSARKSGVFRAGG